MYLPPSIGGNIIIIMRDVYLATRLESLEFVRLQKKKNKVAYE